MFSFFDHFKMKSGKHGMMKCLAQGNSTLALEACCATTFLLTHFSLASFLCDRGNSADPDQTPQTAASDQGLHCLLAECSI